MCRIFSRTHLYLFQVKSNRYQLKINSIKGRRNNLYRLGFISHKRHLEFGHRFPGLDYIKPVKIRSDSYRRTFKNNVHQRQHFPRLCICNLSPDTGTLTRNNAGKQ